MGILLRLQTVRRSLKENLGWDKRSTGSLMLRIPRALDMNMLLQSLNYTFRVLGKNQQIA
jgi:hypothetical protein